MYKSFFIIKIREDFFQLIYKEGYECLATGSLSNVLKAFKRYTEQYTSTFALENMILSLSEPLSPPPQILEYRKLQENDVYTSMLKEYDTTLVAPPLLKKRKRVLKPRLIPNPQ